MADVLGMKGPITVVAKAGHIDTHGNAGEDLLISAIDGTLWVLRNETVIGVYASGEWISASS
ncbi:MAG: hypothetical protein H6922_00025 [Pseudomonadaceae bacterium]|nr:hypothetical protein [Pseudomonadaceae bacterium]